MNNDSKIKGLERAIDFLLQHNEQLAKENTRLNNAIHKAYLELPLSVFQCPASKTLLDAIDGKEIDYNGIEK